MDQISAMRRRFIVAVGGGTAMACSAPRMLWTADSAHPFADAPVVAATMERDPSFDNELRLANAWVGQLRQQQIAVLTGPVSGLQRQFRLGYKRACALAQRLEHEGIWTIFIDYAGNRSARIAPLNQLS